MAAAGVGVVHAKVELPPLGRGAPATWRTPARASLGEGTRASPHGHSALDLQPKQRREKETTPTPRPLAPPRAEAAGGTRPQSLIYLRRQLRPDGTILNCPSLQISVQLQPYNGACACCNPHCARAAADDSVTDVRAIPDAVRIAPSPGVRAHCELMGNVDSGERRDTAVFHLFGRAYGQAPPVSR